MAIAQRLRRSIAICPGFNPPELTQSFLADLDLPEARVVPTTICPLDGLSLFTWIIKQWGVPCPQHGLILIGYSAGVIGAIAAARKFQAAGGWIERLIAVDGWGVPLMGPFPIHRVSHDWFTHWSSRYLGAGQAGFYADPPVSHEQLWRSPYRVTGYIYPSDPQQQTPQWTTAGAFLHYLTTTAKS